MVDQMLVCHGCGTGYTFNPRFDPCDKCKGPLDVEIDIRAAFKRLDPRAIESPGGNIWKFAPFYPVAKPENIVTLGEGGTQLLRHSRLNTVLGLPNLLIKNEAGNPTWSFKDRLNAINVSLAREFGYRDLVAVSTGNHGASAAAYAAAAGISSLILLPNGTPEIYGQMIQACGGLAALTDWHGRSGLLAHLVQQKGWFPSKSALPTPISNPFGLQVTNRLPMRLRSKCGHACPITSWFQWEAAIIFMGFLRAFASSMSYPLWIGSRCWSHVNRRAPIRSRKPCSPRSAHIAKVDAPSTIAVSISEGITSDHALRAVRGSAGFAASPTDAEIMDAMRLFASVGLVAESSSCVPLAAARRLVVEGKIPADATIVLILTSAGIKWPKQLSAIASPAISIKPKPEALDELLAQKEDLTPVAAGIAGRIGHVDCLAKA